MLPCCPTAAAADTIGTPTTGTPTIGTPDGSLRTGHAHGDHSNVTLGSSAPSSHLPWEEGEGGKTRVWLTEEGVGREGCG